MQQSVKLFIFAAMLLALGSSAHSRSTCPPSGGVEPPSVENAGGCLELKLAGLKGTWFNHYCEEAPWEEC